MKNTLKYFVFLAWIAGISCDTGSGTGREPGSEREEQTENGYDVDTENQFDTVREGWRGDYETVQPGVEKEKSDTLQKQENKDQ